MNPNNQTTYIYNTSEVKLTGRYAQKSVTMGSGRIEHQTLVEIESLATDEPTWKRWVNVSDLFAVYVKDADTLASFIIE